MAYRGDCDLPISTSLTDSDLITYFSQQNGSDTRISAANAKTYMQQDATLSNGLLSVSSVYEMYQTANTYNYGVPGIGVEFALNGGLTTTRILPAGRTSIVPNITTGEFVFQRDCQAVMVSAQIAALYASSPLQYELRVKVEGAATYVSPLRAVQPAPSTSSYTGLQLQGIVCNPNNTNNYIKAGEKIKFYAVLWSNTNAILGTQLLSIQTLDGV